MTPQELKTARKARKAQKKAAKLAQATAVPAGTPVIEFAAPCTSAEFYAPLPSAGQALRAKINR